MFDHNDVLCQKKQTTVSYFVLHLFRSRSYFHLFHQMKVCVQILFLLPLSYVLLECECVHSNCEYGDVDCEYVDSDCEYDDVVYEYVDSDCEHDDVDCEYVNSDWENGDVKQMNCLKLKDHQKCFLEQQDIYGRNVELCHY